MKLFKDKTTGIQVEAKNEKEALMLIKLKIKLENYTNNTRISPPTKYNITEVTD
jgi:hypothetical protein